LTSWVIVSSSKRPLLHCASYYITPLKLTDVPHLYKQISNKINKKQILDMFMPIAKLLIKLAKGIYGTVYPPHQTSSSLHRSRTEAPVSLRKSVQDLNQKNFERVQNPMNYFREIHLLIYYMLRLFTLQKDSYNNGCIYVYMYLQHTPTVVIWGFQSGQDRSCYFLGCWAV
jgi:hypothetical protein